MRFFDNAMFRSFFYKTEIYDILLHLIWAFNEVSLIQIEQLKPLDLKITCKIVWNLMLTGAKTVNSSSSFFFRFSANKQQKLILLPDVTEIINKGHKCAQI